MTLGSVGPTNPLAAAATSLATRPPNLSDRSSNDVGDRGL
jgi:hypothetical protein